MNLNDYWLVLLTGLLAGGLSCAAVQGGLLTALVTRQRDTAEAAGKRRTAQSQTRPSPQRHAPAQKTAGKAGSRKQAASAHQRIKVSTVEPPKPWHQRVWADRGTVADDLAPVGGFLTGKLISHALLGLLLGALGSAVQFSTGTRAWAQILAGLLIVAFGLAQLQVRGFTKLTITSPAVFTRFVRGRTRSQSALAPAILGFFTILIPCGVTLSVMALAVTTQSPWAGALTMAIFVIGTSPLFAAIGYAARKATRVWQGRLATATGLVILAVGAWTLNGGLTLIDSPLAATNLVQTLGLTAPPATAATVTTEAGTQTAILTATTGSYSPANIQIAAGIPTTLIVRASDATGCVRAFNIKGKQYILPENGDTTIDLGTLTAGELRFRCGMGMYTGKLTIKAPATPAAATQGPAAK